VGKTVGWTSLTAEHLLKIRRPGLRPGSLLVEVVDLGVWVQSHDLKAGQDVLHKGGEAGGRESARSGGKLKIQREYVGQDGT
jgi:hypothetical protein